MKKGWGSHHGGTDSQSRSLFSVHFRALGRSEDHERTRLCMASLAAFCLTSSLFPHHVAMYPPASYSFPPERCSLTCSLCCLLIKWTRFQLIGVPAIYFVCIFLLLCQNFKQYDFRQFLGASYRETSHVDLVLCFHLNFKIRL